MNVPSFSVRLLEKAIEEPQNISAKMPKTVARVFSSTGNASCSTEKLRLYETSLLASGSLVLPPRSLFLHHSGTVWLRAVGAEAMADMSKYQCNVCGYIYDPAEGDPSNGVQPGTAFSELPDGWRCPLCGADKSQFTKLE